MADLRLWTRVLAATVWAGTAAGTALAQEGRFEYRSDNGIERSDPFIDQDAIEPEGAAELVTGFDTNNWLRHVRPVGQRRVWRFEQQVRLRAYDERDDLNSLLLTPRVQYWRPLGENWQARASAAFSWLNRDGDRHYARVLTEGQLRYRPEDTADTVMSARYTHYDFGDQVVAGLDQSQWRLGLARYAYTPDRARGVSVAGDATWSDADAERFSYTQWRVRGAAWTALDDNLSARFEVEYLDRDYDGDFSATQPFARTDTRWRGTARLERGVSERAAIYGEAGYVDNDSNIASRAYSGGVFRIGFRIES